MFSGGFYHFKGVWGETRFDQFYFSSTSERINRMTLEPNSRFRFTLSCYLRSVRLPHPDSERNKEDRWGMKPPPLEVSLYT